MHNTFKPSNDFKTSKPFRGIINFKPLNITTLSERENNPIRVIREAIRSKESSRCRELDDHSISKTKRKSARNSDINSDLYDKTIEDKSISPRPKKPLSPRVHDRRRYA